MHANAIEQVLFFQPCCEANGQRAEALRACREGYHGTDNDTLEIEIWQSWLTESSEEVINPLLSAPV